MKIRYREAGEFAGLIKGVDVDTDALPNEQVDEVRRLVQQSGILESDISQSAGDPNVRDAVRYEVAIEDDDGTVRSMRMGTGSDIPDQVRPLIRRLRQDARVVDPE